MAELNLERLGTGMGALVKIQKEMLTILRASSTAMKVQSKAMETLGESAREVGDEIEKTQTKLGRFIETKLRATSGAAGIFHKVMYGVPGYFIFKNRLDTLLSGIDKFIVRPLSGDKKDGFMNKVLYGVGGSFRKSKDQLLTLNSLVRDGPQLMQGPAPKGGFRNPNTGRFESRPELNLMTWITKSKLGLFVSKSMHELKKQGKWNSFKEKLSAKGKTIFGFIKTGGLFFASALLVMAKFGVAFLGALIVLFFIVKALKRLGVSASFFEEWGRNILEFVKKGISMIGSGVGKMAEGIGEIYSAIFGDGDINDLLDGFFKTAEGLLEVFGGLLLIILSPLLALIQTSLEAIYAKLVQNSEQIYMGFAKVLALIGIIAAFVAYAILTIGGMAALIAAAPYLIVAGIIGAIGILLAAINPFANGGVTKSGLSLVGERGPELVRLPKGSRVHSNQESRRMMSSGGNNITVNINGRVGSSDSELRIIAQKVGKMINKEINRTTSSRSLGA